MCEVSCGGRSALLFDLVNAVGNSLSLEETLAEFDTRLRSLIDFEALGIWLPVDNRLAPGYVSGIESLFLCRVEVPLFEGATGIAIVLRRGPVPSSLALPLVNGDDLVGVLALLHRRPNAFAATDREILREVLPKAAAAILNALRFERVERLASVDPESSLLNERALFLRFDTELARARRNCCPVGVLVGDFGRTQVEWSSIADALREVCREDDCVARMGEGFVLVLSGLSPQHLPEKQKRVEALLSVRGISAEIGAAFYPEDGACADDLLAIAGARRSDSRS